MKRAPGAGGTLTAQAESEANRRAANILESMPVAFLAVDQEWRLTYANGEAERFARRRREDVLGRNLWAEFPEMAGTPFDVQLHRALAEQVPVQFVAPYPPQGPWFQVYAYPADGGLAVYCEDISERKRVEDEREGLRAEAERRAAELDAVIASAADAVLIYDAQGRIVRTNSEAERILGYRLTERDQLLRGWMGTRIETVDGKPFPPEDAPLVRVQRGETVRGVPAVIRRPLHAPVWLSVSAARVRTPGGENLGVVLTAADVTALHELQEETLRLLEAARRSRGEAEAAQSRLEAVLEQMPSGVAIAEAPSGRLVLGNEQMARIWGRPFPSLAGVEQYSAYQGFHPDGRPYEPEEWPLARSIRTGEEVHDEVAKFARADGSRGTMSISSAPIRDRNGHTVAAVAVFRDISERNRACEKMRESEERFRRIFEEGPLGMIIVGLDSRFIRVNGRLARLLGYSEQEMRGLSIADITYPDDSRIGVPETERLQRGEIPYFTVEKRYVGKDGRVVWGSLTATVIHDDRGTPIYTLAMIQDISERKQAERALRRAKEYAERLVETANVMVVVLDAHGRVSEFNAAAEEITGYARSEVMGRSWFDLLVPRDRYPYVWEMFDEAIATGHLPRTFENPVLTKSGEERYILFRNSTLEENGQITATVSFGIDITERRRLLEAERQAREQAEAAVRARDEFMAASAHELKTPLTSLRGHAQTTIRRLQREEAPDPERTRRALATIDRQADRLARLVQQLLDVSSMEAGQLHLHRQETDLVPLVRDLVESVQAGTRRHALTLQAPPSIRAWVDPDRIEQVAANLLDNAVKFSPEGTPVEVELATPEPGMVRLSVRDHGPGIPPEQREQLFSRFFQAQTGRPFAGLGLGLYYSRGIVEAHGGRIWAEFPEDGGSRFVVELPREETEGAAPLPQRPE